MPVLRRHVEAADALSVAPGDVRPGAQQLSHDGGPPVLGGRLQRRPPVLFDGRQVGPARHQQFHGGGVPRLRRQVQRRVALRGARSQQPARPYHVGDHVDAARLGGAVQRGPVGAAAPVDGGPARPQEARDVPVAAQARVMERGEPARRVRFVNWRRPVAEQSHQLDVTDVGGEGQRRPSVVVGAAAQARRLAIIVRSEHGADLIDGAVLHQLQQFRQLPRGAALVAHHHRTRRAVDTTAHLGQASVTHHYYRTCILQTSYRASYMIRHNEV